MKRCWLICFSVLILAGCAVINPKPDLSKNFEGFRGYKWGTSIENVKNELVSKGVDEKRQIEWFNKKNETLKIGKADLESISYIFQDGNFIAVSIISKGESNYVALRKELETRFGKPESEKPDAFTWDLGHATVLFSYGRPSDATMLVIRAKGY